MKINMYVVRYWRKRQAAYFKARGYVPVTVFVKSQDIPSLTELVNTAAAADLGVGVRSSALEYGYECVHFSVESGG